jgi:uncharacterized protein with PQ loop repeat
MVTSHHVPSTEWRLATLAGVTTLIHLLFITFTTFFLILTDTDIIRSPSPPYPIPSPDPGPPPPSYPAPYPSHRIELWATFLGLLSTTLAVVQYAPQLWTTFRAKTVGALSIPMMCIQTPGAILMVTSIAIHPGTNWTSWITYAAAGIMQGSLLVMCICWKIRQKRLDIDDFGRPLHSQHREAIHTTAADPSTNAAPATHSETTPLLGSDRGQPSSSATPATRNIKKTWNSFWKK